jgi:hypothetical protein
MVLFLSRAVCLFAVANAVACASSSSSAPTGPVGGPASGPADTHCSVPTKLAQPVDPASCHPTASPDAGQPGDAAVADASAADASVADAPDATPAPAIAETRFGTAADDDCKYHATWSSTDVRRGQDVTFSLGVTTLTDGKPAAGAAPDAEVYLTETHPAPNSGQKAVETSPGNYTVGPIRFDASGRWTVRFHLYGACEDALETSPHGHVAFYVDVP